MVIYLISITVTQAILDKSVSCACYKELLLLTFHLKFTALYVSTLDDSLGMAAAKENVFHFMKGIVCL
jgi:hypothetical protein